jgi:hypothetical protein
MATNHEVGSSILSGRTIFFLTSLLFGSFTLKIHRSAREFVLSSLA